MKSKKNREKRKYLSLEKRLARKHFRLLVGLFIFDLFYNIFIEPPTIGHDIRYSIYIFWLPIFIGIVVIAIYRWEFVINSFSRNRGYIIWAFIFFYFSIQAIVFSYLIFGQMAKMSWDLVNFNSTKNNIEETIICDVTKIWTGKNSCIYFKFNEHSENFKATYSDLKGFIGKDPSNYVVRISGTKGIWNYYTVNSWTIERK